jgi:hypothetical protein
MENIKTALIWIFGSTRKDAISSIVAILTFTGLSLQLITRKDITAADIMLGMSQIIGLVMMGKSASLLRSDTPSK